MSLQELEERADVSGWDLVGDNAASRSNDVQPDFSSNQLREGMSFSRACGAKTWSGPLLPWEKGIFKRGIFETSNQTFTLATPTFRSLEFDAHHEGRARKKVKAPAFFREDAIFTQAITFLEDLDFVNKKQRNLNRAISTWKQHCQYLQHVSRVAAFVTAAVSEDNEAEAANILEAVFASKAPSTLAKRSKTLSAYLSWCGEHGIELDSLFIEANVWSYMQHLRETGSRPTVASTFLETLRFVHHVMEVCQVEDAVKSKRINGLAKLLWANKKPLKQARELTVEEVKKLHSILDNDANLDEDQLGAGLMLFCIYGRARWSDFQLIDCMDDCSERRCGYVDLFTKHHKLGAHGQRISRLLPICVPSDGIVQSVWVRKFLYLRTKHGLASLHSSGGEPGALMPAPNPKGGWFRRPTTTQEGSMWLRGLLGLPKDGSGVSTHSLKATGLSWAAKGFLKKEDRLVLGRHSQAAGGMEADYSRDLQARALQRFSMLIEKIRLGLFQPDKPRGSRWCGTKHEDEPAVQLSQRPDVIAVESSGESEAVLTCSDSTDCSLISEEDAHEEALDAEQSSDRIESIGEAGQVEGWIHLKSSIFHRANQDQTGKGTFLACGRPITNMFTKVCDIPGRYHQCMRCMPPTVAKASRMGNLCGSILQVNDE